MLDKSLGPDTVEAVDALMDLAHPRKAAARMWAADTLVGAGSVSRELWRQAADAGLQSMLVPTAQGGAGASAAAAMLTFEGLGLGAENNGLVFALASQVFAMQRALVSAATPQQLDRWLPVLMAGDAFGSFSMSEPESGSNTANLDTVAMLQPDGSYVLNGAKTWVTLGPVCDVAIVFATTDPARGSWGTTAFLVPADTPGFERGRAIEKMGLTSCPFGELTLIDCHLPADAVLGRPGSGAAIFGRAVEAERVFLYAAQVGAMERVLDRAAERARTRMQGGTNIGSFQAVSHRIVDMRVRHEAARLLAYKAAVTMDRGEPVNLPAVLAKLQIAEMAVASAVDAIRVFGASGYTVELGLEVELRDAVGGLAYSGTLDVARNTAAALMHLDRPSRRSEK